jgi:hypothetical protein
MTSNEVLLEFLIESKVYLKRNNDQEMEVNDQLQSLLTVRVYPRDEPEILLTKRLSGPRTNPDVVAKIRTTLSDYAWSRNSSP